MPEATRKLPRKKPEPEAPDFLIVTGLSGAGRSEAAHSLEDLGYFVVDNLPPALIGKMAELAAGSGGPERVAIVADVRGGVFFSAPNAGLELDVRLLRSPYWVEKVRPLRGTDQRVRGYVHSQKEYGEFMKRLRSLLEFTVPGYVAEGKSYLSIAVGCTGGRHRSVVVAEELGMFFMKKGMPVTVEHRDLHRE